MKLLFVTLFFSCVANAGTVFDQVDDTSTETCPEDGSCQGRLTQQRAKHTNLRRNDGTEILGQATSANSIPVVFPSDASVVVVTDNKKSTYSTAVYGLTVASSPTDVLTIQGSATKTVKVTEITFSATKTANGFGDVLLIRRSAANTGGTSTTATNVTYDTTNASPTAVIKSYTANPSALGTEVGKIAARRYFYSGLSVDAPVLKLDFGRDISQPITLRGTSEFLNINLNGTTLSGNLIDIFVEFTEE